MLSMYVLIWLGGFLIGMVWLSGQVLNSLNLFSNWVVVLSKLDCMWGEYLVQLAILKVNSNLGFGLCVAVVFAVPIR